MGDRPVTVAPSRARAAPSIRENREAGSVAGAIETQPGIRSRRATAGKSSSAVEYHAAGARSHRPARTQEAPGRVPGSAPDTGIPQCSPKRVKPDPVPGFAALPWLTGRQNEDRGELYRRLAEWQDTLNVPPQRRAEVDEAAGLVSRIEQGLSRAEQLLRGMRTRLLSEAEWSELTALVERARADTPRLVDKAKGMLDGLVRSGGPGSTEAGLLKVCLQRLVTAHEFLTSEALPWQGIVKRVELPPEEGSTSVAAVESRVVPGTAFGSRFARGYSWEPGAPLIEKILSGHVPQLAQTRLTGATGETLFRGLHQGFIGLPGFSLATLRALPPDDLSRLVGALIPHRGADEAPHAYVSRVEALCLVVGQSSLYAGSVALSLRRQTGLHMAMESAAAALCSDPEGLRHALDEEAAEIKLFDVSLLDGSDFTPWCYHYVEQFTWQSPRPISLKLRGTDREPCRISAIANVRQFALSVEDQGPDFSVYPGLNRCVVRLLGEMNSRALGGDARERAEDLRARVRELGGELAAAGYRQVRTLPPRALGCRGGPQTGNRVAALQAELVCLEKNARALEQAGRQLKELWMERQQWPTGADAYRAAARLALVAYLMGETPVLSCASGRDYNQRLDEEVKVLATVTDCHGGQVPPADLDTDTWDTVRAAFREQ